MWMVTLSSTPFRIKGGLSWAIFSESSSRAVWLQGSIQVSDLPPERRPGPAPRRGPPGAKRAGSSRAGSARALATGGGEGEVGGSGRVACFFFSPGALEASVQGQPRGMNPPVREVPPVKGKLMELYR